MKGSDALRKLKKGKKLRRKSWHKNKFIYLQKSKIMVYWKYDDEEHITHGLIGIEHFLHDDWEIVNDRTRSTRSIKKGHKNQK